MNNIRNEKGQFVKGHPGYMTGRKHSPESIAKMAKNNSISHLGKPAPWNRGEKSNLWKGGVTAEHLMIRESLEYKNWRRAVFERDDYTCIWCNAKSGNGKAVILNADHIKRFADYPELRFDLNNGRTLCVDCHKKTSTMGRYPRKDDEWLKNLRTE